MDPMNLAWTILAATAAGLPALIIVGLIVNAIVNNIVVTAAKARQGLYPTSRGQRRRGAR